MQKQHDKCNPPGATPKDPVEGYNALAPADKKILLQSVVFYAAASTDFMDELLSLMTKHEAILLAKKQPTGNILRKVLFDPIIKSLNLQN